MTNQDRAEKIVKIFIGYEKASDKSFYDEVLVQLDEAVANEFAEGALDQQRRCAKHCEQQRAEGFAAAREQAAGMFKPDKYPDVPVQMTYEEAYDRILAMGADK